MTAPGQGAQTPGFLAPWLELPGVAERLGAASELAGCDLIRFGTTADAGLWDIARLRQAPWYDPEINRLTNQEGEESAEEDLQARYYIAWDDAYLYLGAEVHDNINDFKDSEHAPDRWYFKDAISFFIEVPADQLAEKFGAGDNAFCFVIDPSMPSHGAWWRHGSPQKTFIEEPLPEGAVTYTIRMDPWKLGRATSSWKCELPWRRRWADPIPTGTCRDRATTTDSRSFIPIPMGVTTEAISSSTEKEMMTRHGLG